MKIDAISNLECDTIIQHLAQHGKWSGNRKGAFIEFARILTATGNQIHYTVKLGPNQVVNARAKTVKEAIDDCNDIIRKRTSPPMVGRAPDPTRTGMYLSWRKTSLEASGKVLFPDDMLFVTHRNGNKLQSQDVRKMIRVLAKRSGIDRRVWPHLLRHSLATNMVNRNAHLLTIRDQLGHVYIQSTMIYVHRSKNAHGNDYRQHAPSYL